MRARAWSSLRRQGKQVVSEEEKQRRSSLQGSGREAEAGRG
ncbi:MAG: hypothetical protein QW517_09590 [Thermofilaceae archaeon]